MRKLLVSLSAVVIAGAQTTTIVGCTYNHDSKKVTQAQTKMYSEVTAEALKSAILFDQNFNLNNRKDVSIDINFATNYYGSALIKNVFPNLISGNDNIAIQPDSQVSELYKMAFGKNQGGFKYNFTESVSNKTLTRDGVRPNSKLSTYIANPEGNKIIQSQPDGKVAQILGVVAGGLNIILGNDFTNETAGLVSGVINTPLVADLISPFLHPETDQQKKINEIINLVLSILNSSKNTEAIDEVLKAITQEEIAAENPTSEVLSQGITGLFASLIFFIQHKQLDFTKLEQTQQTASEVFFDLLLKVDPGDVFVDDEDEPGPEDYHLEISYGAKILNFVNILATYLGAFDEFKSAKPVGPNYLFSNRKTNGQVISEVLNQPYKKLKNNWYKEKNEPTLYALFNLQNMVSDLQLYLSPDKTDFWGLNTLKLFTILLGRASVDGNSDQYGQSPLRAALIEEGIQPAIVNLIEAAIPENIRKYDFIGLIDNIGAITANILNTVIDGVLKNQDLTATFGGPIDGFSSLLNLIAQLTSKVDELVAKLEEILRSIGIDPDEGTIGKIRETIKSLNKIVQGLKTCLNYLATTGRPSLRNPWDALYSGTFVYDILSSLAVLLDIDKNTLDAINRIGNIKNLLTTNLSSLFSTLQLSIPDFLYKLNNVSIAALIDEFAQIFNTNRYQLLKNNNQYFINSYDLKELITSLLPSNKENSQVLKDGVPVSLIELLLYTIADGGKELNNEEYQADKELLLKYKVSRQAASGPKNIEILTTTPTSTKINTNLLNDLLGLDTSAQPNYFYQDTLYYAFSRFYGHYYARADQVFNPWFKNQNGNVQQMLALPPKVLDIVKRISNFANESIDQLIIDKYSRYLARGNFSLDNVKTTNLDKRQDYNREQTMTYTISYWNPDTRRTYFYNVKWIRPSVLDLDEGATPNDGIGWRLVQLKRQN